MAIFNYLKASNTDLSLTPLILAAIPLTAVCVLLLTRLYTTLTYRLSLQRFSSPNANANSKSSSSFPSPPPTLPYTLPILGHALSWTNQTHGFFFRNLQTHFTAHPALGSITLLLAGQRAHILNSPDLVTKLFKTKAVSRERFNRDIMIKAIGLGDADDRKAFAEMRDGRPGYSEMSKMNHDINIDFLLDQRAVNVLTTTFMEVFQEELTKEDDNEESNSDDREVPFYEFLRERMFTASTTALYGREIVRMNPELSRYYWDFDNGMLARLFGIPRFMTLASYESLDFMVDRWEQWVKVVRERYRDEPPQGMEWDELMGSSVVRERHRMYSRFDLSDKGRACFDLGFMFGLNSNAIPATGWTLSHLLSPENAELLRNIQREVESARRPDGSIDINVLTLLPYLNSAFNETLRMYVDVLVTRTLDEDLTLNSYHMKKGGIIIAPSFLGHHDGGRWAEGNMPPDDVWYGERFLKHDEKTGNVSFSTAGMNGKFFPFGGGAYVCPGRVFAKQEVFGAIAAFLLAYEVQFIEYVRFDKAGNAVRKGTHPDGFPVVKKQFCGSGVVISEGDMMVKLKRRKW